jgi:hypothetical protein
MSFSKAKRLELFEIDAKWHIKVILRMVMNMVCASSIACAVFVLIKSDSKFAPKPYLASRTVLAYIPCVSGACPDLILV